LERANEVLSNKSEELKASLKEASDELCSVKEQVEVLKVRNKPEP